MVIFAAPNAGMEKLSVVIITYNEEKNIGRCIDSVKAVADEVVVLDSFSSDRTVMIAQEKGAVVHQQKFAGYGAQKNAAAALAGHDYTLYLDADEFLSPALEAAILEEKQNDFPADAYSMNRLNNYCGKWIRHGSWYPDKKIRLLRREKGRWTHDIVHESIQTDPGIRTVHLPADLLHYAYTSLGDHISKNNRYSTLSAQLKRERGQSTNWFKILFNPFWNFLNSYIFRLGFLDGFYGFVIAVNIAHLTFMKHYKLYALKKGIPV